MRRQQIVSPKQSTIEKYSIQIAWQWKCAYHETNGISNYIIQLHLI
jgi:hypothetical protein